MGSSFDLKDLNVAGWGWLLFGGIVMLACGFFTIYYPVAGVVGIVAVSGSAFIIGGFLNIYLAFQLKNLKNDAGKIKDAVGKIKAQFGVLNYFFQMMKVFIQTWQKNLTNRYYGKFSAWFFNYI